MTDEDTLEMHKIRLQWFLDKGYSQAEMMSFLVCEFVGTMAIAGYDAEFAKKTFDRMYQKFLDHPKRKL